MFLMAGHETTGQTLAYTLWELGKRPDIQAKLREEVMNFPGDPSYDDISEVYCSAGLRENRAFTRLLIGSVPGHGVV